jgi:hypothetical protein
MTWSDLFVIGRVRRRSRRSAPRRQRRGPLTWRRCQPSATIVQYFNKYSFSYGGLELAGASQYSAQASGISARIRARPTGFEPMTFGFVALRRFPVESGGVLRRLLPLRCHPTAASAGSVRSIQSLRNRSANWEPSTRRVAPGPSGYPQPTPSWSGPSRPKWSLPTMTTVPAT